MGLWPEPLELRTPQQTEGRGRRGLRGLRQLSQASTPDPGLLGAGGGGGDGLISCTPGHPSKPRATVPTI